MHAKSYNALQWFAVILAALSVGNIAAAATGNILVGAAALTFTAGGLILQGLRKIPADPPHVADVTFLGKRLNWVKGEGWKFFFLYPWVIGFIPISVKKVNQNLDQPAQKVRTPDNAESEVSVFLTWTPDSSTKPEPLEPEEKRPPIINFIDYGKHEGVAGILKDIVQERIREWARASDEGPKTWEQLMESEEEATNLILKAIVGKAIESIPSSVPTAILLRFFAEPKKKLPSGWTQRKIETMIKADETSVYAQRADGSQMASPEYRLFLKDKVDERRKEIRKARGGNGVYRIPQMGIVLNRLNIGEIRVLGEVGRVAELQAKEKQERAGEREEKKHYAKLVLELRKDLKISEEQAIELIQTERGKVKKEIAEKKLTVSPETRAMIERIVPGLAGLFRKTTP